MEVIHLDLGGGSEVFGRGLVMLIACCLLYGYFVLGGKLGSMAGFDCCGSACIKIISFFVFQTTLHFKISAATRRRLG